MKDLYSAYEAKAKLSEILRMVRSGRTIRISYRGEPVAEIRPLRPASSFDQRLQDLLDRGVVVPSAGPAGKLAPVKKAPGALKRFLAERDS